MTYAIFSKTKLIRATSLVFVLGTMGILTSCEEQEIVDSAPVIRPVLTMTIGGTEKIRTDVYHGRAKATQEVNLAFEVSGKVLELNVDVGDRVKEGDVLATLNPAPFQAEINRVDGEKAALEAELSNVATELERRKVLLKKDFVSQARVDNQNMKVRATEAKIKAVNGALEGLSVRMGYTVLTAPYSGTISEKFIENFQNIIAKQPVMRLLDTSQIEMTVNVPEDLISLAKHVKTVSVSFSSLPDVKIPAKIKEVSNEASLTTRTYPVTVIMKQPEGSLIVPGMAGTVSAEVELPSDWKKQGVDIPSSAVFSPKTDADKKKYVWIVDETNMQVNKHEISVLGLGKLGLLVDGLKGQDRIVTTGVSYLKDGQIVKLAQ